MQYSELDSLANSTVDSVRFTTQYIEIRLYGGFKRERKYATLQIEADFTFTIADKSYVIKGDNQNNYPLLLRLMGKTLEKISLSSKDDIHLFFADEMQIEVYAGGPYEAWTLDVDDIGFYVGTPG